MDRAAETAVACLLLLALAPPGPLAAAPAQPPDLSGTWILDAKRSQDLADDRGPGRESREGEEEGRRRGPGGFGDRERDRDAIRSRFEELRRAAARLEIRRDGEGYRLRDGAGEEWSLIPDGRERTIEDPRGGELYLRVELDGDGRLVVRRVRAGLPTVTETYELSEAADDLLVAVAFSRPGRGEARLHRIYTRAVPAEVPEPEPASSPAPTGDGASPPQR